MLAEYATHQDPDDGVVIGVTGIARKLLNDLKEVCNEVVLNEHYVLVS